MRFYCFNYFYFNFSILSFNSLYEIRLTITVACAAGQNTFNSLYEILIFLGFSISWKQHTFNSLYEIPLWCWSAKDYKVYFQFSLWDSSHKIQIHTTACSWLSILFMRFSRCRKRLSYILHHLSILFMRFRNPVWIRYKLKNFQFSLWDSWEWNNRSTTGWNLSILFMRFRKVSLYCVFQAIASFNSLYEIHLFGVPEPDFITSQLSILFMRF